MIFNGGSTRFIEVDRIMLCSFAAFNSMREIRIAFHRIALHLVVLQVALYNSVCNAKFAREKCKFMRKNIITYII